MENVATNVLSNSTSVIAIVAGVVIIVSIISWLVNKGKLNIKSNKFNIESTKQNTKSLIAECRENCQLMLLDIATPYLDKYKEHKFLILYTMELCLNFFEKILQYNNVTLDNNYLQMRWVGMKAIVDSHRIPGVEYTDEFYSKLHAQYVEIMKQIVLLKNHYKDENE